MIGRTLRRAPKPSLTSPYICFSCLAKRCYAPQQTRSESTSATASELSTAPLQEQTDVSNDHATSRVRRAIDTKSEAREAPKELSEEIKRPQTTVKEKGKKGKKKGNKKKDKKGEQKGDKKGNKEGKNQKDKNIQDGLRDQRAEKGQRHQRPPKAHRALKDQKAKSDEDEAKIPKTPRPVQLSLVQTIKAALEAHQKSLEARSQPKPRVEAVKKVGKQKPQPRKRAAESPADTLATVRYIHSPSAKDGPDQRAQGENSRVEKSGTSIKQAMLSKSKNLASVVLEGHIENMSSAGLELTRMFSLPEHADNVLIV